MAHVNSVGDHAASDRADTALFKPDHRRSIDRYIDYFEGRPGSDGAASDDACGERLLDALGDPESESGAA